MSTAVTSFIASNLLASTMMSGALQFLWGTVNALQMIVLTCLFSVMRPKNAEVTLIAIMAYVNLDIFPVEKFINFFFDFPETEPFNPIFELAGYESTTYILELGVIFFIIMGFAIVLVPARSIFKLLVQKFGANNRVTEYLKGKSDKMNYKVMIVRFL